MARKQTRVPIADTSIPADDFTLIKGIGPTYAERLRATGVQTFAQLASCIPAKLAAQVGGLPAKRIIEQDWLGQAKKLAGKNSPSTSYKKGTPDSTLYQHYENFTIELLLDGRNEARRTRVMHIQSGSIDTWSGWEPELLIDFITRHTEAYLPSVKSLPQKLGVDRKDVLQGVADVPGPVEVPELISSPKTKANRDLTISEITEHVLTPSEVDDLSGILHLNGMKVCLPGSEISTVAIREGQPFTVKLNMDLDEVVAPMDAPLSLKLTIIYKQLGGTMQYMNEVSHVLVRAQPLTVEAAGESLPPGIYRVDAFARLSFSGAATILTAFLEGNLLQVF